MTKKKITNLFLFWFLRVLPCRVILLGLLWRVFFQVVVLYDKKPRGGFLFLLNFFILFFPTHETRHRSRNLTLQALQRPHSLLHRLGPRLAVAAHKLNLKDAFLKPLLIQHF